MAVLETKEPILKRLSVLVTRRAAEAKFSYGQAFSAAVTRM